MSAPKPVILCILDGWGKRQARENNAVALSATPNFDRLMKTCPNATLKTSGRDVGLPDGQMGNSEVGHMNIGAGRVVSMDLGRIGMAIEDGSFTQNPALLRFIAAVKKSGGAAHLLGVVSDGGVHSHIDHMIAAANAIGAAGVPVFLHAMTDGRDVPPGTAKGFIKDLETQTARSATLATVCGRYYAMDRDKRWDRVKLAFDAIMNGRGETADRGADAVDAATKRDESDEFIRPTVIADYDGFKAGDGVFCLNFRADRAREIMSALTAPDFDAFDVAGRKQVSVAARMSTYSDAQDATSEILFPKETIKNTLGEWVSAHGLRQFRLAETEKYPHVTFFLNGGVEPPEKGEDRNMPQSPKVATYDLQPEMSSVAVGDQLVQAIIAQYDLIVVNFANPDMVGHTGSLPAAIAACEAVDAALGRAIAALETVGGAMIVTADHGNCETMVDPETGKPHTAHTTNPVPVILAGGAQGTKLRDGGRLADLAPTLLDLMQIEKPSEMTGKSLLQE